VAAATWRLKALSSGPHWAIVVFGGGTEEVTMSMPRKARRLEQTTEELVRELIDEPDRWLDTKNDQLGGARPRDLLNTEREPVLRGLLEAIRDGSFS
jgi:hypothetical protein